MPKKLTRRPPRPRDPLQEAAEAISDRLADALGLFMDRVINKVFPEAPTQRPSRPASPPPPPRARKYNLYDELEVSPRASQETIAAAWKSLSKRYHPDVNKSKEAIERIKQVNAAYTVLGKPESRKAYDQIIGIR